MSWLSGIFKTTLMPRHITTIVLGIISGLIIHIYLLSSEGFSFSEMTAAGIGGFITIGIFNSYIVKAISIKLNGLISWQHNAGKRLAAGLIINSVITFLILCICYKLSWTQLAVTSLEYPLFGQLAHIKLGVIVCVIVFIFSIIYYALYSYSLFGTMQIKEAQLQRELVETRLKTLKGQLTPHFLFNSLNTISSLIHRDNDEAEDFIRKLARTYQYTLNNYEKNWVPLNEELEIVTSYVHMMKTRFGDGVNMDIRIPEYLEKTKVLPLSIQTLVENAIKHNRVDHATPLKISIIADNKNVTIRNNKTGSPKAVTSHKIGLSNLKKRYAMILDRSLTVENLDDSFTVKIPVS